MEAGASGAARSKAGGSERVEVLVREVRYERIGGHRTLRSDFRALRFTALVSLSRVNQDWQVTIRPDDDRDRDANRSVQRIDG